MRVAALLLLAACSVPPPADPFLAALESRTAALAEARLDDAPAPETLLRVIHGRTACLPVGGVNPGIRIYKGMPKVGRELRLTWVSRYGPNPPDAWAWAILSVNPMPMPLECTPFGAPGCWLLVNPDVVLGVSTSTAGALWREGGVVEFRWTPPPGSAGTRFFLQMLFAAPGENRAGLLATPAVEVSIGS